MTNNIPPHKLLPQDMVIVFDHGPEDKPHASPVPMKMHAVDAKHAMDVEPNRYAFEDRVAAEEAEKPKLELVKEPEHTGADGPADTMQVEKEKE